jgi:hypothetical protein
MSSETRKQARVFPLHIAPIDWYFLCDDSKEYPMVFYLQLDFIGDLDRDYFDCALEEALKRHPLLYAIVQPAKQNKPCWVLAPELMPRIEWTKVAPLSLSGGQDFEIPACNMTAYTFINRLAAEIADEEKLLSLIRDDTLQIKNGSRQKTFMNGLTSAMATPFVLQYLVRRNVCLATSVLSNAGDPSRRFTCRVPKTLGKVSCKEFTLEGISGVPPLRRMTRCTLSSSIYGRKLTFSMRCDPHSFSQADSAQLLQLYCSTLLAGAAELTPVSVGAT